MTGPVAVRGAKAGQVLEVRIKSIELHYDWGYNVIRPLAGALPDDFTSTRLIHIPLDRARMTGRLPWGLELPLKPFFGVMVVGAAACLGARRLAAAAAQRRQHRQQGIGRRHHALFADPCRRRAVLGGDGHGVQGDGEVCITAIETGLIGTFELHVRDDLRLEWPMAETPTDFITMGFDPDLDDAAVIALREMIKLICARTGLSREDAYTLCSLAADLRVTQLVNGSKGIHVVLNKALLKR